MRETKEERIEALAQEMKRLAEMREQVEMVKKRLEEREPLLAEQISRAVRTGLRDQAANVDVHLRAAPEQERSQRCEDTPPGA